MGDKTLSGLLDKLDRTGKPSDSEQTKARKAEDAWIAKYDTHKQKVIRPTMELLGQEMRKRGHDFNIVEHPFKRMDTRPLPQEAMIRIDLYLANERTRTVINAERRPSLRFETHHRSQMVQVWICDITSRGGVDSKIGDFTIDQVTQDFIKDKFLALVKRVVAVQGSGAGKR